MTRSTMGKSFMRRAFDSMVSAREKQANRYINGYLLAMDDESLSARGYDRSSLAQSNFTTYHF